MDLDQYREHGRGLDDLFSYTELCLDSRRELRVLAIEMPDTYWILPQQLNERYREGLNGK